MSQQYKIPEGFRLVPNNPIFGLYDYKATAKAIETAARLWFEDTSQPKPEYSQLANVTLSANKETKNFNRRVWKEAEVEDKVKEAYCGVDHAVYCMSVAHIVNHGWGSFIETLAEMPDNASAGIQSVNEIHSLEDLNKALETLEKFPVEIEEVTTDSEIYVAFNRTDLVNKFNLITLDVERPSVTMSEYVPDAD